MARHKVITHDFETPKEKRAKREAKIKYRLLYIVSWVVGILNICCIIVVGSISEMNIGWGYLAMSILDLGYLIFLIYAEVMGWSENYEDLKMRQIDPSLSIYNEARKNELTETRVAMVICCIFIFCVVIATFVMGIRALMGLPVF